MSRIRFAACSLIALAWMSSAAAAAVPARSARLLADAAAWPKSSVAALGQVRSGVSPIESAGNILAVYVDRAEALTVRVSLVAPVGILDGARHFEDAGIRVAILLEEPGVAALSAAVLEEEAPFAPARRLTLAAPRRDAARAVLARAGAGETALDDTQAAFHLNEGWAAAVLPHGESGAPTRIAVYTYTDERILDRLVVPLGAQAPTYSTNVAFLHHGNQGLAYSDVFFGRSGAMHASGYDEVLESHQKLPQIPGNFHLGALLQTAAEWDARNGNPVDFNAWLRAGVTEGWAGMAASAYGQPIMPFLQDAMNDWAVARHTSMTDWRYDYTPRVAWVPERVWLTPGQYPEAGVIDYSGDHWTNHGVQAVILDDWPHGQGYDNHQIHTIAGSSLRVILRDGNFTGKMHAGDGAGALQILTDLANNPVGPFRIVTYADDWEMAAEVAGWENTFPFALDAYEWMIDKCRTESAWLSTWKLADALGNPNFNGSGSMAPTYGTYGGIGDVNGYGGNNNAWYTDYAGYIPYVNGGDGSGGCAGTGGNCKNHGQLWNDAHAALQAAPDNAIREAGWYVLMTNLHETGWHDYLGGPLSGWQRQYAGHIKNANVYAEAARWAGGLYASATGAFFSDIDNDGFDELLMHNDRVFGVFEGTGARCTHLFARGPGYAYPVIGVDNAYWYGTEADYNDGNHIAGLSDVGPNYQHDGYGMAVNLASGDSVRATFTHAGLERTVTLRLGQPFLDVVYRVGASTQYIQSGFSPDLVDLVWNAQMDRVFAPDVSYMGQRNPNTAATAAYVLGGGGAGFNMNFSGTLMKVDEIQGSQKFRFYLYAGSTSAPDMSGHVAELQALAASLGDQLAPEPASATYFPATQQLAVTFDEAVRRDEVTVTGFAIDDDDDGIAEVTLDPGTLVVTGTNAPLLTLQVTGADHAAIQALNLTQLRLLLAAGAVKDVPGNPNAAVTNADDVLVSYGPPTLITLDGRFDPAEWPDCAIAVADSFDSGWNSPGNTDNEIQAVYATWDDTYLYLGLRGVVTGNSWLLYLDTDPGGPNGEPDLTAIDVWERGVQFTAPGFRADFQFGAYQHQGPFDSRSFFRIASATTTADSTASILAAFDPNHAFGLMGGSEIAIPWQTLYSLAPGAVPPNAQLGLVATLCWDPEPGGEAGGDQAPNNLAAPLPTLDNRRLITIDGNGDGLPDPIDRQAPALVSASPTGWDSVVTVVFDEPVGAATANVASRYTVFETANPGQTVSVLAAALQPDEVSVELEVTPMLNTNYTVVASGIADTSCYANVAQQTIVTFQGPLVDVAPVGGAAVLRLSAPRPNPTRGESVIEFTLPGGDADARLELYDLSGRRRATLAQESLAPGRHFARFTGQDESGAHLAPGLYFVRLSHGSERRIQRLVIMP